MIPDGRRLSHGFQTPPGRRDFLRIGALTSFGLTLQHIGMGVTRGAPPKRAKSCVLIWLDGGPSHLETLDPKPNAPREVRGPFAPIPTNVSGIQISELMPKTAAIMDQVAVIRSMTSPLGEHNFGTHYLLTGYKPTPALNYPAFGSVVSHLRSGASALPNHVAVPNAKMGGGNFPQQGYLPAGVAPFEVGGDPGKPNFRVRDLAPFAGITESRLDRRRAYLKSLEQFDQQLQSRDVGPDPEFEQAYRMVSSAEARLAFDLERETPATRKRYGSKSIGQSCLLARRLIEAGVPFVTVNNRGWDTHEALVTRLKDGYTGAKTPVGLVPSLDQAFTALIGDLHERSLLEDTLVVVMGEFGRTPKLNTRGGRDHWPRVFSVMLAGAGIAGGQIIGSSDAMGESPADRPVTPADLAATVYSLLDIAPTTTLHTPDGRPVQVAQHGIPLPELTS